MTIARNKFSLIKTIVGAAIAIVGFLMRHSFRDMKMFDLGWIMVIFGGFLFLSGAIALINPKKKPDLKLSQETTKRFLVNNAIMITLIILVFVIVFIDPRFIQLGVLHNIMQQSATRLILALGVCFTLLIAGTDLSAGRMVGLAAVISTSMLQEPTYSRQFFPGLSLPVFLPIILAILACMFFGLLNGFLVAKFGMHPFIATLAIQVIIFGAVSLYFDMPPNNSQPIGGVRGDFKSIGQYLIGGSISILIPIALVVTLIIWFVLNYTVFGKNVYAIGGNREAAVVSGVNTFRTIIIIFVLASALYGIAGVLEAARVAGATNQYGTGYELDAIAACVVGGVSLNGGVGKVSGIVSGVLIFTVIQIGLQFISVGPMWTQVIKGIIIATAVAIDMAKYKRH